jgi:outer membrane protein OmpA-like peptidoglycan-associated protein
VAGKRVKWLATLLAVPAMAAAQGANPFIVDLEFATADLEFATAELESKTVELVFNVENVGGTVQALELSETPTEIRIDLAADVLFAFDSADIQAAAEESLSQAADVIKEYGDTQVTIDGHTDARGADAYNLQLSEQRANAVRDWFVNKAGVSSSRFATRGLGEAYPVAPNANPDGSDNPEGRQQNRRVEIRVQKQ